MQSIQNLICKKNVIVNKLIKCGIFFVRKGYPILFLITKIILYNLTDELKKYMIESLSLADTGFDLLGRNTCHISHPFPSAARRWLSVGWTYRVHCPR